MVGSEWASAEWSSGRPASAACQTLHISLKLSCHNRKNGINVYCLKQHMSAFRWVVWDACFYCPLEAHVKRAATFYMYMHCIWACIYDFNLLCTSCTPQQKTKHKSILRSMQCWPQCSYFTRYGHSTMSTAWCTYIVILLSTFHTPLFEGYQKLDHFWLNLQKYNI